MNPEDVFDSNQDIFITTSTCENGISLDELSKYLCAKKVTAELRVAFSQGGRRQVIVTEHTKLKPTERVEVRRILKI